jgi:hypothetical protein
LKIARALFIGSYRISHTCLSLKFDHYLRNIDQTYIFTNVPVKELDKILSDYEINTTGFIYVPDEEMDSRWPTMRKWFLPNDYRGSWLYQQALKLASIEYCDADITLIQDPDTFCIQPYECLTPDGKPKFFILPNTTHSPGYYRALDSLGIKRQTPHCFVTEFMPAFKEDWLAAKYELEKRNNCDAFDAIINAVPFEGDVKWFSEYEFLGNWTMTRREVAMDQQTRFDYRTLDELDNLTSDYNCVCDQIPNLNDSLIYDWHTKTIPDFDRIFEKVKKFL